MARTNKTAAQIAEDRAAEDQALLDSLKDRDGETVAPEPEEEQEPRELTIADRFVGMNELLASEKRRLVKQVSETTLIKTLELALNYHVWSTQRQDQLDAQAQQRNMFGNMGSEGSGDEGLVGPDIHEHLTSDDDNVIGVNFTPDTDESE